MRVVGVVLAVVAVQVSALRPICQTCECLPSSVDVDCRNRELREVPADLTIDEGQNPWLLDLSANMIRNITQFPDLQSLVELRIQRNFPNNIVDGAFLNLAKLNKLDLSHNQLTCKVLNKEAFRGGYSSSGYLPLALHALDLSYNNFTKLELFVFQHLPNLTSLILAHNPIRDLSVDTAMAINQLKKLEELDLSQTQIDRLPAHFLTDLQQLKVLILAGNNFKKVSSEINYCPSLRHINLNANPIEVILEGDFTESLKGLEHLEISSMPEMKAVQRRAFSSLTSLEVLYMSDNPKFSVLDNEAFYEIIAGSRKIKEIHLQDNHLTTLGENVLNWLDLQYVDVQNNPWNCDCNLRWMAEKLIPDLEEKNPSTTLSLLCAQPDSSKGRPLVNVLEDMHGFECENHPSYMKKTMYGSLFISTIIVGILLLITGTLIFAYVLFRRTRSAAPFNNSIKYRRARNEDDEMPTTIQS